MKNIFQHVPKGTTLMQLLIYFTIAGVVLLAVMTFAIQILTVNRVSINFHELQSNIDFISEKMVSTIQSAVDIDASNSVFDQDQGTLALNMNGNGTSQFYLSNENVFLQEGASNPVQLNSDSIKCDIFRFHRVVYLKAPDQIVIDVSCSPKVADISNLDKNLDFHVSVSLRTL